MAFRNSFLTAAFLATRALSDTEYAGVNESGGEFGSNILPGEFGVQYEFINPSTVDIYTRQNQINLFRVPFLLERMCPPATGLGSTFNETYFSEYKDAIDHITTTDGAYAILDPHNYMRYGDPSSQPTSGAVIGSNQAGAATTQDFQDFWQELATRFLDNDLVIFGIMNEPHDMDTSLVLADDQAAVDGIRAAGAKQLILAPGNGYTGGHSWLQSAGTNATTGQANAPSADYLYQISDPLDNTAIDIHEYLDVDFSGSHQACTQPGPSNLAGLTSWLQQYNLKALISETGAANNTQCANELTDLLNYINDQPEYIGWALWSAGPFWGTSAPCCGDGQPLGSLEPGVAAGGGGPPLYQTVWQAVVQPFLTPLLPGLKRDTLSTL
ncbi:MAG: hypothetical protein Q9162_003757 [Coniocarpon cinnabarinum]